MAVSLTDLYRRITEGPPFVPDDLVREVLRERYGLDVVELTALPGETDRNFRVRTTDGEWSFRVARAEDRDGFERQARILDAVDRADPGIPTPRPRPAADGSAIVEFDHAGAALLARVVSWVPGEPLSTVPERSTELLRDIGAAGGRVAAALATVDEQPPGHYWDLSIAAQVLGEGTASVGDDRLRDACDRAAARTAASLERLADLPRTLVHHDLNALNILVSSRLGTRRVSGIIDFGDAIVAPRIADLAILLAAVTRGQADPVGVSATVTREYCAALPLGSDEIDELFALVIARTATVALTTARLTAEGRPGDPRHRRLTAMTEQLERLLEIDERFATSALRDAAGLGPDAATSAALGWIASHAADAHAVVTGATSVVDLSAASAIFDDADAADLGSLAAAAAQAVAAAPGIALGRHAEPQFAVRGLRGTGDAEPATTAAGLRVFAPEGTVFAAPWDGVVEPGGSGEAILSHRPQAGTRFWTRLLGAAATAPPGATVRAGEPWARSTGASEQVVVQLATVDPAGGTLPTLVPASRLGWWETLLPDPSALAGITRWQPALPDALEARHRYLPWTHPTYFEQPINMVRAKGTWFFDEDSRMYLDALNNVTLVGHCHPRLIEAATRQMKRLNTNSRFVYDSLTEYTERLAATLPDGLDVVYMLSSGSEANDLALRAARHITGRRDFVIIDDAYHGNTNLVSDVSPSRFKFYGKPEFTHVTLNPDRYRGPFGYDDPEAGAHYAALTIDVFDRLIDEGRPPAAYIYEPLLAGGGQVVLPPGFLAPITHAARERGILTISDEVQVGFGRLGEAFWGFQTQGPDVVPDFVSLGKAMGNGFPVAAMVTHREHSERFDELGRFFATYGGNPVAAVVALELLNVMQEEGLQQNALEVGQYFRDELASLGDKHPIIGDVRGQGFYSGVEFVLDRETKEPAKAETLAICDRLKDEGVLVYPTGPFWNILKLKPPLTFSRADADLFVSTLDRVLSRGW